MCDGKGENHASEERTKFVGEAVSADFCANRFIFAAWVKNSILKAALRSEGRFTNNINRKSKF